MLTNGQGPGLGTIGTIWNSSALGLRRPPEFKLGFGQSVKMSDEEWRSLPVSQQNAILERAENLNYAPPIQTDAASTQIDIPKVGAEVEVNTTQTENPGLGGWFKDNKDMIGAGLGAAQLGLGILNYNQNKKALKSELESAEQVRRLNEERAQNKRTIQNKAQTALRFDI